MMLYSDELTAYIGKPYTCYGIVKEIKQGKDGGIQILCRVKNKNILCYYNGNPDDAYNLTGREILFTLHLKAAEDNLYIKGKKAGYFSSVSGFQIARLSSGPYTSFKRSIQNSRRTYMNRFKSKSDEQSFLNGILFGDTSSFNENLYENFRNNGTAHILAVSGLHVGIIYGIYAVIRKKVKNKIIPYIFFLFLFIYGTAASWSVSVIRAVIMIVILVVGDITDRRYDMFTAAFFSSILILFYKPFLIFSAGFQMSFLAVISIAFLMPLFREYMGSYLSLMVSVQVGMMPYMLYSFGNYSFKGIICNVPTVFLAGILVPAGVFSFIFYYFFQIRFVLTDRLLFGLSSIILGMNKWFNRVSFMECNIKFYSLFSVFLFYAFIFFASSEFFTVHRIRKEYIMLLRVFLFLCIVSRLLSYGINRVT